MVVHINETAAKKVLETASFASRSAMGQFSGKTAGKTLFEPNAAIISAFGVFVRRTSKTQRVSSERGLRLPKFGDSSANAVL
jgi:hypothetical protein